MLLSTAKCNNRSQYNDQNMRHVVYWSQYFSQYCTSMWFFPLGCYIQQLRVFYLARFAELCDVIFNTYKIDILLFQCTILPTLPAVAMGVMEVGVLIAQHLLLLRQPQPECHTYFKSSHLSEENILCTVRQWFFII